MTTTQRNMFYWLTWFIQGKSQGEEIAVTPYGLSLESKKPVIETSRALSALYRSGLCERFAVPAPHGGMTYAYFLAS